MSPDFEGRPVVIQMLTWVELKAKQKKKTHTQSNESFREDSGGLGLGTFERHIKYLWMINPVNLFSSSQNQLFRFGRKGGLT